MPWLIPALLSIWGGVQQYKAGQDMKNAAGQQERLAYDNEQLEKQELEEGIRRQEIKNKQLRGKALSLAAASGVEVGGSAADYLDFINTTQTDEVNWMRKAGLSKARLNLQAGLNQAEQTRIAGKQSRAGAFASFGQAGFSLAGSGIFGGGSNYSFLQSPGSSNVFTGFKPTSF